MSPRYDTYFSAPRRKHKHRARAFTLLNYLPTYYTSSTHIIPWRLPPPPYLHDPASALSPDMLPSKHRKQKSPRHLLPPLHELASAFVSDPSRPRCAEVCRPPVTVHQPTELASELERNHPPERGEHEYRIRSDSRVSSLVRFWRSVRLAV